MLPPPLPCSQAAGLPFTGDLRAGRHCRDHQLRISAPRGPGWPARPSRPRHFQSSYSPLPRPVFFYWCRGLHLFPLGAATVLIHREDKIPLLGTDPPRSPEVLLDGRRAQRDVHLKGARWYFTRSRILALLPCSLFPEGERGEGEAGRVHPLPRQPKVRGHLRSLGFFGALSAACAEGIPALLSGGAGFARGVPAVFRVPRAPRESSGSGPKTRACPPASQMGFAWSSRSAGGERA